MGRCEDRRLCGGDRGRRSLSGGEDGERTQGDRERLTDPRRPDIRLCSTSHEYKSVDAFINNNKKDNSHVTSRPCFNKMIDGRADPPGHVDAVQSAPTELDCAVLSFTMTIDLPFLFASVGQGAV